MNKKLVLNTLSKIGMIEAALMLLPMFISIYYHDYITMKVFLFTALLTVLINAPLLLLVKPVKGKSMTARDGIAVAALGWIFLSVFGSIPYYVSGQIPHYMDALFESISGFTTTGASILGDVEALTEGMM